MNIMNLLEEYAAVAYNNVHDQKMTEVSSLRLLDSNHKHMTGDCTIVHKVHWSYIYSINLTGCILLA